MKKILIMIFLSCSMFFVISAFYTKSTGKEPIGFSYVLKQFQDARIGFDIQNDIKELSTSMSELNDNMSSNGIEGLAKTIYYSVKFFVKLVFHSLIACINIIICVCRCIGLYIPYIHFGNDNSFPFAWSGDLPPTLPPGFN